MKFDDRYHLLIGGDRVDGEDGETEIENPATEKTVGAAPQASVAQAEAAAAAAAEAFATWSRTSPEERATILDRAAALLDQHLDDFIPLVQAETGATITVTRNMQVPQTSARLRRYARGALEPVLIPLDPFPTSATALAAGGLIGGVGHRAPVGVVTCIASYNFPMVNMIGKVAPALAMGNTVIVKPAPQDPLAVIRMCELLIEAGAPPGVVNCVTTTDIDAAEVLTTSPPVDMVSFTGSTVVGRRIAEVAGSRMKRLLLELGGKGACLVLEDADLASAARGIASVWGFHSGQICTAPTRVIVHRSIHDQLVEALTVAAAFMKVGDPLETETIVGPVISGPHRERVEGYVQSGRDDGAEVVAGGDRPDLPTGYYVNPTLLTGCTNDMTVAREEIFGPVVVVIPFDDLEDGIAIANDSEFGLYDYVFSGDTARAFGIAKRLEAGNVGINTLQQHPEAPFGGFKHSGVGRDRGSYALHAYSELQSIAWPG